jgi:hypothetical protein
VQIEPPKQAIPHLNVQETAINAEVRALTAICVLSSLLVCSFSCFHFVVRQVAGIAQRAAPVPAGMFQRETQEQTSAAQSEQMDEPEADTEYDEAQDDDDAFIRDDLSD